MTIVITSGQHDRNDLTTLPHDSQRTKMLKNKEWSTSPEQVVNLIGKGGQYSPEYTQI
ncbi:hypothetical protein [Segetibacter sp. 3557_3]|uniref:hypothetical protein n=1 Tax=Segetibacter sp. 3557_3 TaxID=2547429 RepID=UPI001404D2E8|nr:hypothetical protein [Segetibacter sp. 3557_3]